MPEPGAGSIEHTGQFPNTPADFGHIDRCESEVKALSPDRHVRVPPK